MEASRRTCTCRLQSGFGYCSGRRSPFASWLQRLARLQHVSNHGVYLEHAQVAASISVAWPDLFVLLLPVPSDVEVFRDGSSCRYVYFSSGWSACLIVHPRLPAKDLIPGDIIAIGLGSKIPADCRIVECSSDAQFDRSILTGEVRLLRSCLLRTDFVAERAAAWRRGR